MMAEDCGEERVGALWEWWLKELNPQSRKLIENNKKG